MSSRHLPSAWLAQHAQAHRRTLCPWQGWTHTWSWRGHCTEAGMLCTFLPLPCPAFFLPNILPTSLYQNLLGMSLNLSLGNLHYMHEVKLAIQLTALGKP